MYEEGLPTKTFTGHRKIGIEFYLVTSLIFTYLKLKDNPKYGCTILKNDGGKVLVWCCFFSHGVNSIHRIEGIMEKKNNILQFIIFPYTKRNVSLRLQYDNDTIQTSKLNKECFKNNKIEILGWSAQSPGLNVIENLWKVVKKQIRNKKFKNHI